MQKLVCNRCGFAWWVGDQQRVRSEYCADCRMKSAKTIRSEFGPCLPWHGAFDEFDRPIKGNALFAPGLRLCDHSDCVEPTHIVGGQV